MEREFDEITRENFGEYKNHNWVAWNFIEHRAEFGNENYKGVLEHLVFLCGEQYFRQCTIVGPLRRKITSS